VTASLIAFTNPDCTVKPRDSPEFDASDEEIAVWKVVSGVSAAVASDAVDTLTAPVKVVNAVDVDAWLDRLKVEPEMLARYERAAEPAEIRLAPL
jgi:hypothetical protein